MDVVGISGLDYAIFFVYLVVVITIGLWASREKKGHVKDSNDYFLAGRNLPWWAIGASIIAANISAEQFIGMSGSGYMMGLAIAAYEWMAAITVLLVAKYFLPIFLEKKIFTMPQLLEKRFDNRVRTALSIFWLLLYTFVNLTSISYLGARALNVIMGLNVTVGIFALFGVAAIYTIVGGLKSVAWTDIIQILVLIVGGLVTTYCSLNAVADKFGDAGGAMGGFAILLREAPEKFSMIFSKDSQWYSKLPGIWTIIGGMWIANFFYWGCNQYITQKGLAAKSLKEAQRGLVFAAYLKILTPVIVVIPGIAAAVLHPEFGGDLMKPDDAFPWVLKTYVPTGIIGLSFAALFAAIVSSLAAMINSIATIFSMDIYSQLNKDASEKQLVGSGRIASAVAIVIAIALAPLLKNFGQIFQFIQEFTGFVSPGILVIFMVGMFWKKATANSAVWAAILTLPIAILFKIFFPKDFPFLNRMGIEFLVIAVVMVVISLIENKGADDPKAITDYKHLFKTGNVFNIASIGVFAILAVIYLRFW